MLQGRRPHRSAYHGRWRHGDSEWARAVEAEHGPIRLAFQESAGIVEVGLQTPPLFVASLCIERGDQIHMMHASSAVGHGTYVRRAGTWTLTEPFEWRLRGADGAPATANEQSRHFELYGWVANTVTTGMAGQTDFRISARFLGGRVIRMALGLLLEGDGSDVEGWPPAPGEDGCTDRSTIAGPLPDSADFHPSSWALLEFEEITR